MGGWGQKMAIKGRLFLGALLHVTLSLSQFSVVGVLFWDGEKILRKYSGPRMQVNTEYNIKKS